MQAAAFESLNEENRRLREIREASKGVSERTLIAEIIASTSIRSVTCGHQQGRG